MARTSNEQSLYGVLNTEDEMIINANYQDIQDLGGGIIRAINYDYCTIFNENWAILFLYDCQEEIMDYRNNKF